MPDNAWKSTAARREQRIADTFIALTDTLGDDFDIFDHLRVLTTGCVGLLPVTAAGVLLADHDGQQPAMAASDELTGLLELFEMQNDEGPGLDCYRSGTPITNASLAADTTAWPAFAARARDNGHAMTHALPLRIRSTVIGALNLFADTPDPLGDPDLDLGRSLAEAATIGILHQRAAARGAESTAQLQQALTSRIVIEQAKGVLAERMQIHVDAAFAVLRAHARNHNQRLSEVARMVAEGAELDSADSYPVPRVGRPGIAGGGPVSDAAADT